MMLVSPLVEKTAQIAQNAKLIFDILGRIEGYIGKLAKHIQNLLVSATFAGELDELRLVDWVRNSGQYLVYHIRVKVHKCLHSFTGFPQSCVRRP